MALTTVFTLRDVSLNDAEKQRIERQLKRLERRLGHYPEPVAEVTLIEHVAARRFEVDLRVQLGPLGSHLISHQSAETVDRAVHLAVEDVERELERQIAKQRGEHSFGTPSRRRPTWQQPGITPISVPGEKAPTPKPD
jgi:ribosome-associated translation inhibitor RaiA